MGNIKKGLFLIIGSVGVLILIKLVFFPRTLQGSFSEQRNMFSTNLIYKEPAPQEYEDEAAPKGVNQVIYKSGKLELMAWISGDPEDSKKHPAVVYAHGGFSFSDEDWSYTKPYLDAGFVVMTPTFRGENGNPGHFEFFYGEVDDLIAAGDYISETPYVDKDNIYLIGHGSGGTLSILTSMLPSAYKAIVSIGGSPDQFDFFSNPMWAMAAPFDVNKEIEIKMRSPNKFIKDIQKPLYLYVGNADTLLNDNLLFYNDCKKEGKSCEYEVVSGDSSGSITPSIYNSIDKFSVLMKDK